MKVVLQLPVGQVRLPRQGGAPLQLVVRLPLLGIGNFRLGVGPLNGTRLVDGDVVVLVEDLSDLVDPRPRSSAVLLRSVHQFRRHLTLGTLLQIALVRYHVLALHVAEEGEQCVFEFRERGPFIFGVLQDAFYQFRTVLLQLQRLAQLRQPLSVQAAAVISVVAVEDLQQLLLVRVHVWGVVQGWKVGLWFKLWGHIYRYWLGVFDLGARKRLRSAD